MDPAPWWLVLLLVMLHLFFVYFYVYAQNVEPECSQWGTEVKTVMVEDASGGHIIKKYEPICIKEKTQ